MAGEDSISEQKTGSEKPIFSGTVYETYRDLGRYAECLGYSAKAELVTDLEGKDVLDVGSGLGGLVKSAVAEGVKTRIISVNPRLSLPKWRHHQKDETELQLVDYLPKSLKKAQRVHDHNSVAAFAQALPFKDSSFDLIFDNFGVSYYSGAKEEIGIFEPAIKEMLRVLRQGGHIRIGDICNYGLRERNLSSEPSENEQILIDLGIDYKIVWAKDRLNNQVLGIDITKK